MSDKHVIAFKHPGSRYIPAGARSYLMWTTGDTRHCCLARSRSGRWVKVWVAADEMTDLRVKVIPPEHPLYGRLTDYGEQAADIVGRLAQQGAKAAEVLDR